MACRLQSGGSCQLGTESQIWRRVNSQENEEEREEGGVYRTGKGGQSWADTWGGREGCLDNRPSFSDLELQGPGAGGGLIAVKALP